MSKLLLSKKFSVWFPLVLVAMSLFSAASELLAEYKIPLSPNSDEFSFDFETELMEGTIRLDGAYHGVSRLIDKRTSRQVIDSRYSALNLFKLMSVNQAMDQPRHMPREIKASKYWVEVTWAATDGHKAQLTARYEVSGPSSIDITVTVTSQGVYRDYELFMSNYFDKSLRPYLYLQPGRAKLANPVVPMVSDVIRGTVLVFPRDAHAARHCLDGRWERSERKTPTVQMCPVRHYLHCLALMTDPERSLGILLMARPRDCYAISARYFAENDADRLTTYTAFDHSLFGVDLAPGSQHSVKVRLALTELDQEMTQPVKLYREFLEEVDRAAASNE